MSSEVAIWVRGVSKSFNVYEKPVDRLNQALLAGFAKVMPVAQLRNRLANRAHELAHQHHALSDISVEIRKGETVGIIGRNGSGKSTLLQIICGTLNPTAGTVEVNGRVAALLELGSGFDPEFTGRENVYMNGQLLGLTRQQIDERFADIEAFADIDDFMDQPVKSYSSGMYVRLAFAVIAHVDADVLIIDEALAVGDAFFTQKCMRFLRGFMETGTVLFVSHDTASIKSLCTHAIWIDRGTVRSVGEPKNVCDLYLQEFFESQQGKSAVPLGVARLTQSFDADIDVRRDKINASNLRNDLQIFRFDENSLALGTGGAHITDVAFFNDAGERLHWVLGGELVSLCISITAMTSLRSLIAGFYIKDSLGQTLFGENTYLSYESEPVSCDDGQKILARFEFRMPVLPKGNYSINAAVAEGTQDDHVQLHWIHDALIFKSESTSVSTGLMGVPMRVIALEYV